MLSKLSKLVMGLLHKKSMNPYELIKLINMDVVQDWFPLTAPSIYTTIKNIEKKGYISGETLQEGKLPPKTVYVLTEAGERELVSDLGASLASYEAEASHFGIALFHIGSLQREDALRSAHERLDRVKALLAAARQRLDECESFIPFNMKMMLRYNVYRLETEAAMTEELIGEIERDTEWDTSFVRFLKREDR